MRRSIRKVGLKCLFLRTVRAEAGRVGQPEGELHDGGDPREGRERQPAGVRAAHVPHADHRGGRPQPAQARAAGQRPLVLLVCDVAWHACL